MKTSRMNALVGALAALLLAAACGSSDIGDILGGTPTARTSELRGTVDSVDPSSRSILLRNVSYGSNLAGGGSSVRVYYDDQTTVAYQGRNYRPENLERGDEVSVRVQESGDRLIADTMTVLFDASGTSSGSSYASIVRGTVRSIDTTRRTLEIERTTSGQIMSLAYDANTIVNFNGRQYRVTDLERGDEVEIDVQQTTSGVLFASNIDVLRSVSDSGTAASTLRGTVRYVDTSRRTIELENANWATRFNTGSNVVIVQYDANTDVEYQGRLYPASNLERGDIVDVQVRNTGTTLIAQRIVVVQDVNAMR